MNRTIYYNNYKITFNYDILNIHIENSHEIYTRQEVVDALTYIHSTFEYKKLVSMGYTRTLKSQIDEWRAHNVMWSWGYKRSRTGSVDLDQNETPLRKFLYKIISYLG